MSQSGLKWLMLDQFYKVVKAPLHGTYTVVRWR